MKKIMCLTLAVAFMLSISACGQSSGDPADSSGNPSTTQSAGTSSPSTTQGSKATSALTSLEAYEQYIDMKTTAYNEISGEISKHPDLALTGSMILFPIVMVDLTLIPLTLVGTEGGEAALAFLGMKDINIDKSGDSYTIAYTSSNDVSMTQTCEYDAATNSIRSILSDIDESQDSLIFEYAKSGDGYISQYCMYEDQDGEYTLIKMYFNADGDVTIGIETVSGKPSSIFKQTGLTADFAQNDSSCFMLKGGALTIFDDGEEKTY